MIKIKLCGLSRPCDIQAANELKPEYIGFVFAPNSKRYVTAAQAAALKGLLDPGIQAVGVFVNERAETIARLIRAGIIDIAQLHGSETDEEIRKLKRLSHKPVIRAFSINGEKDVIKANESPADYILLDSGKGGTGTSFDWRFLSAARRPYFLAGGLGPGMEEQIRRLNPYGVDVSSGVETDGLKDKQKMAAFVTAVRKEDNI